MDAEGQICNYGEEVLFLSPLLPYPKYSVEDDPVDYFYYRNTLKQSVFQLKSFQSWHSLHLMAQNIGAPSVVAENLYFKEFMKLIESRRFGIVAIGFTVILSGRVLEMVRLIKQLQPGIVVVVGGYGTAIFKENMQVSNELKSLVDYICPGEGIGFMRDLVERKWGIKSPGSLKQELVPSTNSLFRTRLNLFNQLIFVTGLGCNHGCSFCSTSAMFNRKRIGLFDGKMLMESIKIQHDRHPKITSAIIYEEDFLISRKLVAEFREHYLRSELVGRNLFFTVFSSVSSVLKYSIDELLELGIGTIFIGVESSSDEILESEGLAKRKGDVAKLFADLHSHGINTLGSIIIGWDGQDLAKAKDDIRFFVGLNPTFYQVVPLHVVPGTALWDRYKAEGRIAGDFSFDADGITDFNFELKQMHRGEALDLISRGYKDLVDEGGAWPFRLFENLLNGYFALQVGSGDIQKDRARKYRETMKKLSFLAASSIFFNRGKKFRKRWRKTFGLYSTRFPFEAILVMLAAPVLAFLLLLINTLARLNHHLKRNGDQPGKIVREYASTGVDAENG